VKVMPAGEHPALRGVLHHKLKTIECRPQQI
jgi:hypothetical protein